MGGVCFSANVCKCNFGSVESVKLSFNSFFVYYCR